jgi:hypothetical protein
MNVTYWADESNYVSSTPNASWKISREPQNSNDLGMGTMITNSGHEYVQEIIITAFQDDVGSRTFNVSPDLLGATTGTFSWGSGAANTMRTAIYKWLGPYVGWKQTYIDSAWSTSPYKFYAASTEGNNYRRIIDGGATTTTMDSILSFWAQTPLNWRKTLYDRGVQIDAVPLGAKSPFATANKLNNNAFVANGLTNSELRRHVTCGVPLINDPVASTLHELGHAYDFVALQYGQRANGITARSSASVVSKWSAIKATWIAGGGGDTVAYDASSGLGWSGSYGYFIRTDGEWMAQNIACWAWYKYLVANSLTTTGCVAAWTQATPPSEQANVISIFDTIFAGLY